VTKNFAIRRICDRLNRGLAASSMQEHNVRVAARRSAFMQARSIGPAYPIDVPVRKIAIETARNLFGLFMVCLALTPPFVSPELEIGDFALV